MTLHELREDQRWSLDVERLIASLRPETRLVVVNAPHNPTGMLPTAPSGRGWATHAPIGIHLLADEVYRYLELDERDRLVPGADLFPRGVSLGVMSKSSPWPGCGSAGWRPATGSCSTAAPG